jgi:hypothetical protein
VIGMITRKDVATADKELPDTPNTPRESDLESNRSFSTKSFRFRASFSDRTAQDVLFSLP